MSNIAAWVGARQIVEIQEEEGEAGSVWEKEDKV